MQVPRIEHSFFFEYHTFSPSKVELAHCIQFKQREFITTKPLITQTKETNITNEMLNRFIEMENNEKVTSPTDVEAGQDWYLWVYAEDIYGNIVLEKSSEFYIDTTVPTVEFTPNGNTTWDKSQTVEITIDDLEGSGINTEFFRIFIISYDSLYINYTKLVLKME